MIVYTIKCNRMESVRAINSIRTTSEHETAEYPSLHFLVRDRILSESRIVITASDSTVMVVDVRVTKIGSITLNGYQDEESPGRRLMELVDSSAQEKIWSVGGSEVAVSAEVSKYNLSAHSDKTAILSLIHSFRPGRTFFIHGSDQALTSMGQAARQDYYRELYIPVNGESFNLVVHKPRKQIPKLEFKSLNCGTLPGETDLERLWTHLLNEGVVRGITVEQIMQLYSGMSDFTESEVKETTGLLNESPLFKTDDRKLFLFLPVPVDEVASSESDGTMEVNEMLTLARSSFPTPAGLYKVGARFDEKVVLLFFNFPSMAVAQYADLITALEEQTGWAAETNTNVNQVALNTFISRTLEKKVPGFIRASYYAVEGMVKTVFSERPENLDELKREFEDATGITLQDEYLGVTAEIAEPDDIERMEQNQALSWIDRIFRDAEDRLYKKGIKHDEEGKYIELSFISPIIGMKYMNWLRKITEETDWRLKISPNPNQAEIMQISIELLSEAGVVPKRNPGIHVATSSIRVKLVTAPDETQWSEIDERLETATGFRFEYEVD